MNVINLTGNICNDLELKSTQTGKSVMNFNLAVKRPHKSDVTDFFTMVVWNQNAEYLAKYAKKGSKIAISGKLTTRKWEDNDGNKRTAYEIECDMVEILDSRTSGDQTQANGSGNQPQFSSPQPAQFEDMNEDDDVPF